MKTLIITQATALALEELLREKREAEIKWIEGTFADVKEYGSEEHKGKAAGKQEGMIRNTEIRYDRMIGEIKAVTKLGVDVIVTPYLKEPDE